MPSAPQDAETQPLIQSLKRGLYGDHPLDLLHVVSSLMAATEPRPSWDPAPDARPALSLAELSETFEGTDLAPTTAALHIIAELCNDEVLTARLRRALALRSQPMPRWLPRLAESQVRSVTRHGHVLDDGANYYLDVLLPDAALMTAVLYVDHNLGRLVKDAFVVPTGLSGLLPQLEAHGADAPDETTLVTIDPAEARARLEEAVHIGSITFPPLESDTWPLYRPLVQWLLRLLPSGGELPAWKQWSETELAALTTAFLASPYGAPFDDEEHRGLLGELWWFGTDYGTGDPLRWSPVNVEILLTDWFPRKIVADAPYLSKLPRLLTALIRHAHALRGIPAHLSVETLGAVDRWTPDYQRLIRSDRPQGAAALAKSLLERYGGLDDDVDGGLVELVGGPEHLAALTDEPLPEEDFDESAIEEDIKPTIGEILALCDAVATELLDVEHRTACRRLLRELAMADPGYFRGRAAARTSAAAVVWMVAHANATVPENPDLTTRELLEPFGVASATVRSRKFRELLGLGNWSPYDGPMSLESARYLVGVRRAELIKQRDLFD